MVKFHEEMAMQRLDSLGPDFEDYFDVNGVGDDDDGNLASAMAKDGKEIDFYNVERRPS